MENQFMEIIKDAYAIQDGKYIIRIFRGEKVATGTEIHSHTDNHCEIKWDHSNNAYRFEYADADHPIFYSAKVIQHYIDTWIEWPNFDDNEYVWKWQLVKQPN